jgi:flagellar biosynthesis component FlhA
MIVPAALCMAVLFIPLPSVAVKICWLLNCIYGATLLGFSVYGIIKKAVPKPLAVLVLYFTLYTLSLYIGTTRSILQITPDNCDELVLVSKMAKDIFINGPYSGYILFGVALFVINFAVYNLKIENDGNLAGSIKFMRGTLNAILIILVASIMGCCLIGYKKFDMTILDALWFYMPYCCSQFIIYTIPFLIGTVGLDLLRWIDRSSNN